MSFFSRSDETSGDFQLFMNADDDSTLARAIQLGRDESIERACLVKFFRLLQGVRPRGGIDDQQGEMRGAGIVLRDHASDFCQFLHQIVASVQAARCVTNEKVRVLRDGFLVSGKANRGGIGVGIALDDRHSDFFTPSLELLYGSGAKSIGGGE